MKKSIYLSGIAAVLIIAGALYFYTRKPAQEPRSNLILEQQVASGQMTFFGGVLEKAPPFCVVHHSCLYQN